MLVHFLVLHRNCIFPNNLVNYCNLTNAHLSYAWIIVCVQCYFLFIDLFNSLIFVCGKSILYILMGIKLTSLPLPNFYLHISFVLFFHFFNCFLLLVLQLVLIWCCESWKLLILPCQILVLPSLGFYCLACVGNSFVSLVISGFCILSQSGSPSHILSICCHMLGTSTACVHSHSIYSVYEFHFRSVLLCQVYCFIVHTFLWHILFYFL